MVASPTCIRPSPPFGWMLPLLSGPQSSHQMKIIPELWVTITKPPNQRAHLSCAGTQK